MQRLVEQAGKFAIAFGTAGAVVNSIIYNVDAGCRGVIFDRFQGVLETVKDEGEF